jgi:hypothetical protein
MGEAGGESSIPRSRSQRCRRHIRRGCRLDDPTGGREQRADRCQPCGHDGQSRLLARARVAPADQTACSEAPAAASDIDRTAVAAQRAQARDRGPPARCGGSLRRRHDRCDFDASEPATSYCSAMTCLLTQSCRSPVRRRAARRQQGGLETEQSHVSERANVQRAPLRPPRVRSASRHRELLPGPASAVTPAQRFIESRAEPSTRWSPRAGVTTMGVSLHRGMGGCAAEGHVLSDLHPTIRRLASAM